MKSVYAIICSAFLFAACATQTVTPLEEGVVQVDVSAAPVYGRAGAQKMAITKAAQATIDSGYDKFIVLGNNSWNEQTFHQSSNAQVNGGYGYTSGIGGSGEFSGNSFSTANTMRRPEVKLIVRMFKYGQKGAEKAVDARKTLKLQSVE